MSKKAEKSVKVGSIGKQETTESSENAGKKHILRATGLQKVFDEGTFNVHVLKGVYLRVEPGERVAIIGASSSGKRRSTGRTSRR